jgi:hypothetical protein
MTNEAEISPFDSNSRSLCPDDMCLGLVGADGRCNVCGKAGTPPAESPQAASLLAHEPAAELAEPASTRDSDTAPASGSDPGRNEDPDFTDRRLCPDDSCIGVLGDDGRCRECGKPG